MFTFVRTVRITKRYFYVFLQASIHAFRFKRGVLLLAINKLYACTIFFKFNFLSSKGFFKSLKAFCVCVCQADDTERFTKNYFRTTRLHHATCLPLAHSLNIKLLYLSILCLNRRLSKEKSFLLNNLRTSVITHAKNQHLLARLLTLKFRI